MSMVEYDVFHKIVDETKFVGKEMLAEYYFDVVKKTMHEVEIGGKEEREKLTAEMYTSADVLHEKLLEDKRYRWVHLYNIYMALQNGKAIYGLFDRDNAEANKQQNMSSPRYISHLYVNLAKYREKATNEVLVVDLGHPYINICFRLGNVFITQAYVVLKPEYMRDNFGKFELLFEARTTLTDGKTVVTTYPTDTQVGRRIYSKDKRRACKFARLMEGAYTDIISTFASCLDDEYKEQVGNDGVATPYKVKVGYCNAMQFSFSESVELFRGITELTDDE